MKKFISIIRTITLISMFGISSIITATAAPARPITIKVTIYGKGGVVEVLKEQEYVLKKIMLSVLQEKLL